jgi:type I restriction enzyme R subunit
MLKTTGTSIDKIMPPVSRFGGSRAVKKEGIIEKLLKFFEKYFGLV